MPHHALSARRPWALALLCVLVLAVAAAPARAASFLLPGQYPGSPIDYSEGWSVSADGSLAVGLVVNPSGDDQAFYWSGGAMTLVPFLGGPGTPSSGAYAISSDGSTIVGRYDPGGPGMPEAYLWTSGGGYTFLGILAGGASSSANAVNADGTVVVGVSDTPGGDAAFRWTGGVMTDLGHLPGGGGDAQATGVDATGNVVVGWDYTGAVYEAFRWTTAGGGTMTALGTIEGWGNAQAMGVSADGATVVGICDVTAGAEAFRWTAGTGMVGLGLPSGSTVSSALAANADGSVIVGLYSTSSGTEAFYWTQPQGMLSLADYLRLKGVNLAGWNLDSANGVSADGTIVTGIASTPSGDSEAYLASTTGGLTTLDSLADSLGAMAGLGSRLSGMGLSRIQSLLLASRGALHSGASGLAGGDEPQARRRFWVVGSLFTDSGFSGSDLGADGGTGLSWTWDSGLSAGAGLFTGKRSTETGWGGEQDLTMTGPAAFVGYAPGTEGLRAEAAAAVSLVDMDLERGYANGAGGATSKGQTQARVYSLAGRLGWLVPLDAQLGLEPFVMHSWALADLDGYTEDTGPFPASFDSRQDVANVSRAGLEAQYAWAPDLDLWTWLAWNHRWEDRGSTMRGELVGITGFRFNGAKVDQDWGDTGLGLKHRPWDGFEVSSRLGLGIDSQDQAEPDLSLMFGLAWDI